MLLPWFNVPDPVFFRSFLEQAVHYVSKINFQLTNEGKLCRWKLEGAKEGAPKKMHQGRCTKEGAPIKVHQGRCRKSAQEAQRRCKEGAKKAQRSRKEGAKKAQRRHKEGVEKAWRTRKTKALWSVHSILSEMGQLPSGPGQGYWSSLGMLLAFCSPSMLFLKSGLE